MMRHQVKLEVLGSPRARPKPSVHAYTTRLHTARCETKVNL